jgi:DNA-binding NtrC family response regulator
MDQMKILIANAGRDLADRLRTVISPLEIKTFRADSYDDVTLHIQDRSPNLVIACSNGSDPHKGLDLVRRIRKLSKAIPVVFITGQSSEQIAIDAMRAGADDYLKLPFSDRSLQSNLRRLLKDAKVSATADISLQPVRAMVGDSRCMQDVRDYLQRVAATDSTVLITGETGTGKELAAEMIHLLSTRKRHPLIRINCSALPENLVESELFGYERGAFTGAVAAQKGKLIAAGGGGVFFDEIGDMNSYAQAKILRCIESKEVYPLGGNHPVSLDFRIITATNRNLEDLVAEKAFREDLYYRLNVARVHLPPLRERKQDIPGLIAFGLENLNRRYKRRIEGLTDEAMTALLRYDWPGNVRELMNLLEAACITASRCKIALGDFPALFIKKIAVAERSPPDERNTILSVLVHTKWNKTAAANKLNWSRMTLYRKIAKYNIVEKRRPTR